MEAVLLALEGGSPPEDAHRRDLPRRALDQGHGRDGRPRPTRPRSRARSRSGSSRCAARAATCARTCRPCWRPSTPCGGAAPASPLPIPLPWQPRRARSGRAARAIRVGADKVDRMLDAVGETVLHHRRLEHRSRRPAVATTTPTRSSSIGERLLDELQDAVIEMRTLPLDSITAPYPRAVRDLALAEGKEVELVITGGDTQLDRLDPRGHLGPDRPPRCATRSRTGSSGPEERVAAGQAARRPARAARASSAASMVAIELADDGRGVPAELLARAAAAGSLDRPAVRARASPPRRRSARSPVAASASTPSRRTSSGSAAASRCAARPGAGTTVSMLLPLTLALLRVLLCERGGQRFCLPLTARPRGRDGGRDDLAGRPPLAGAARRGGPGRRPRRRPRRGGSAAAGAAAARGRRSPSASGSSPSPATTCSATRRS